MTVVLSDDQRRMVMANVPLVEHIVNRLAISLPASHSRDDLVQTGIMGLIAATMRFDPDNGTAFSTYAGRRIEGAIIDLLRRSDWAPRSVRALERRLGTVEERSRNGAADATTEALARELGLDPGELHRLRQDIAQARLDSLDRPVGSDDGAPVPLSSTVVDRGVPVEETVDERELVGYLRAGITLLPERHRYVIVGYFFEGRSMTELGQHLGVTQSRASQLKDEALKLLRNGLTHVYREAPGADDRRPSARQQSFTDSLSSSQPWRERLAAGRGISVVG